VWWFFSYWSKRRWFEMVWAAAILVTVIGLEIAIARSEDSFGVNGTLEVATFFVGLATWGVGLLAIRLVAWFAGRLHSNTIR
jgi:hypothetical protein